MKYLCSTIICSLTLLPVAAQAEPEFAGEVILGYGTVEDQDDSFYGIANLTASDKYDFQSGIALDWTLRTRARSDQDDLGGIDDENLDVAMTLDLGAGGKIGLSTFNDIGQYPWADGELFNRGSVGVFPVIRKRYDGVADTQFNTSFEKVDPDVVLTYENRLGPVGIDIIANPLKTWDGFDEDDMLEAFPTVEGKLTLPTGFGIYSLAYNNVEDAELQVVLPVPSIGVTLIGRHSINEGDWDDSRTNLTVMYRTQDLGIFKGVMLAHAQDDTAERTMLNLNFGGESWEVKVAGDTDGDYAVEGSYALTDTSSLLFGWDNGHDAMEGFDDAAFPAPVFAAPRGSAFEVAFIQKF